jgi:hypothetical protein
MLGHRQAIHIGLALNFRRNVSRHVRGPMLKGIEGDNTDGTVELTRQEVPDDGLKIGSLEFRLSACAQAVHDNVGGFIGAIRHDWT